MLMTLRKPDTLATTAGTPSPLEDITYTYLSTAEGHAGIALRRAITDALFDLLEAEQRAQESHRFISGGYVRSGVRTL